MNIDFETAVRTLVCVTMGQRRDKRVTVGLIVAVLALKFSMFPEDHIAQVVTRIVLEEGGTLDLTTAVKAPVNLLQSA